MEPSQVFQTSDGSGDFCVQEKPSLYLFEHSNIVDLKKDLCVGANKILTSYLNEFRFSEVQ